MSGDEILFRRCRESAWENPAQALVYFWTSLDDHGHAQQGFQVPQCERQAEEALEDLLAQRTMRKVHGRAALRACDEYLATQSSKIPPRHFRALVPDGSGLAFHLVRRPAGWSSSFSRSQPNHREYWCRRHQLVPTDHRGIAIEVALPSEHFQEALRQPELSFCVGGFEDKSKPHWTSTSPYRCHCLRDAAIRWASLEQLLEEACRAAASIVVLPELTIDRETRLRLCDWLRKEHRRHSIALVVAGSFHESDAGTPLGPEPRRNVARAFDHFGDEVLVQVKLEPMRLQKGRVEIAEDIQGSHQVRLLQTDLGLVGLAICLDFFESGTTALAGLWEVVGPALMLVPSMGAGTTNGAHKKKAEALARQCGTTTLVASQHPTRKLAWGLAWDAEGRGTRRRPVLFSSLWTTD